MTEGPKHRPGDIILDQFVPHLKGADRELARERLQQYAAWLVKVAMRQAREEMHGCDSRESDSLDTIQPTPQSPHP